jgi:hypothetical protein
MTIQRVGSGSISKESMIVAGGLVFVAVAAAFGLMARANRESVPATPAAIPAPQAERTPALSPTLRPPEAKTAMKPESVQNEAFLSQLAAYRNDVAALDEKAAAYRASKPVFAHYMDAFRTQIMPLMLAGEKARQELSKLEPGGATEEDEDWQTQNVPYVNAILAPYLAKVGAEVYQLAAAPGSKVSPEDAQNLGQWVAALQQAEGHENDAWRANPYDPATADYYRFEAYLGESTGLLAAAMAHVLLPLSPSLEEQRVALEKERQRLVANAPARLAAELPQEYVDRYTGELAAAFGQFTDLREKLAI